MIGKTVYKAKVRNNKIVVEKHTITKTGYKYCHFAGKNCCYKSDIGVVIFFTEKEAIEFMIKKLRRSIEMGERYVAKERQLLADALAFPVA